MNVSLNQQLPRILVVDDEPDLRDIIGFSLQRMGYQVDTAESGNAAFERFQAGAGYDIVLSDVRMPDGDGVHLLKQLRASGIQVPFLFMTGFADLTAQEAVQLGAAGLVLKPFSLDELLVQLVRMAEPGKPRNVAQAG